MFGHKLARAILASTAIVGSGFALPAMAQTILPAPVRQSVDANGVDLFLGTVNVDGPALTVGAAGSPSISYYTAFRGTAYADNVSARLYVSGSTVTVSFGAFSDRFTVSGTTYTGTEGNGATLTYNSSTTTYTYNTSSGAIYHFRNVWGTYGAAASLADITFPSGRQLTYTYQLFTQCTLHLVDDPSECTHYLNRYALSKVVSSDGYELDFTRQSNDDQSPGQLIGVSMKNTVPGSTTVRSQGYDDQSLDNSFIQITDSMSRATKYRLGIAGVAGITHPGKTSEDVTFTYDTSNRVASVANPVGTTTYTYSDLTGVRTTTVTDPGGNATIYKFDIASQRLNSTTNPLTKTVSQQYDTSGRLTQVTAPEGNYTHYAYDTRGNVTETRTVAKSGSGLADIVTTAEYDTTCTNTVTCNSPHWTKDPNGNQTDYTYDSTAGSLLTVTAPAPATGATRPKTTYSYTATSGMQLLTGISTCQTTASCVGAADEVKTTIGYNSNLLPTTVAKGAGNGSLTATTTIGYDDVGNRTSVDGPLSGTDDTTTFRYDADRELVGTISPDPDGAGALKRRAVRTTYNVRGVVTEVEAGTVSGTSDTDWAGFTSLQQRIATLDSADRAVVTTLTAGGTTYGVSQQSYDTSGRPDCAALRLNSATWSSLPSAACTLGTTGSYGADRISKASYDAAGHVTKTQSAVGVTGVAADDATSTYNDNGTLATLTDAEGNKTTYEYDGFDRLLKTRYPSTTAGAGTSSTTDYEQMTYDAASEVTARRLRDSNSIGYSYDHLGRLTAKDLPGSELDVAYSYDLLGRPTVTATTAQTLSFGYDALSRQITQSGPLGTVVTQYDLAGRRTSLSWPDSFYVSYDHLVTGEVTAIRENGASSGIGVLATYAYDDLGRRTSLTRGNGTSSSFGYDNVSRLTSLGLNLDGSGTTNDLTLGFSYSPAGQIASTTRSNNGYAWGGAANRNDASSVNGLNQITTVGAGSIGYDSKGNLNSTGSNSYTYSSENLLLTGPSSASLVYDPLLRLYQESGSVVSTTRLQYDGQAMIGEYDTSAVMQRRYVMGPGNDEPLVEYDKSGGSYTRVWLHADERGSIVAQSNDSGATTAIASYDEYGVPASSNTGRFGYTGQVWLPSLGIWYYKARMYAPRLGRFMQTDPIGYADGPNWYNYVRGNPVGGVDPSGTDSSDCAVVTGSRIPVCGDDLKGRLALIGEFGHFADSSGADDGSVPQEGGDITVISQFKWVWDSASYEFGRFSVPSTCEEDWDNADSMLYVLNFVGNVSDATTVVAEAGAAAAGEVTPVADFAHGIAFGANITSKVTSALSIPFDFYKGDFAAIGGDIVGMTSAHFVGKVVEHALKGSKFVNAITEAAKEVADHGLKGGFKRC